MSPRDYLVHSNVVLDQTLSSPLRTFDKNERIRAYLLARYSMMRAIHHMLYRMNDEEFLTYLTEGKIIGFSIRGQMEHTVHLDIPPVRIVACKTVLAFLDLEGRIGYMSYATGKIAYLPGITASYILSCPRYDMELHIMIKDGGHVLAAFNQDKVELLPNTIGKVRQIFNNGYIATEDNKLYRTSLDNRQIVNNLISSNCLFAIATDITNHHDLKVMGVDGKTYLCIGESGQCTLALHQWTETDFETILNEEIKKKLSCSPSKNITNFAQAKMIFQKRGDEIYMFYPQDTLFRSGVSLGKHIEHVACALTRATEQGCDFYAIKYN